MTKRILALLLCAILLVCLLPTTALAEDDYDLIVVQKGDNVKKLLEANKLDYDSQKYVVMVLNRLEHESQLETLSIGQTIKIPKSPLDIEGSAPHLISSRDRIEFYVIPYSIKPGNTLKYIYKLWGLRYDDYVDEIKSLNPGKDLDLLYVGDLYYLPTTENNLKTNIYTTVMSHVLLQDEPVESVLSRYGMDLEKDREMLQRYNVTDLSKLVGGDKLLIPLIWD